MPADQEQNAEDRWLHALSQLPQPQLTSARYTQITANLHKALNTNPPTLTNRWYTLVERWIEPTLVVTCSGFVLVRLAQVLAQYLSAT